jgi:hypothetical protein
MIAQSPVAAVLTPAKAMLTTICGYIPKIIGAIIVLAVGWVVARIIKTLCTRLLKLVLFDRVSAKAGITDVLVKGGIHYTPAELVGTLVYWIAMLIVFVMAIQALGLTVVSQVLNEIVLFIPNVIAAVFLLVLGFFLANFVSTAVGTTVSNAGVPQAKLIEAITRYAIIIFTLIIVLQQLKIDPKVLNIAFALIFGAVCLAAGLAFGLGCKDIVAEQIKRLLKK